MKRGDNPNSEVCMVKNIYGDFYKKRTPIYMGYGGCKKKFWEIFLKLGNW
jgi:hypothetical protein